MSIVAINALGQYAPYFRAIKLSVGNVPKSASFEQAFIFACSKAGAGVNSPTFNKEAEGKAGINTQSVGVEQSLESFVENLQSIAQSLQTQAGNELQKEEASSIEEHALRIQKELLLIGACINAKDHPESEEVNKAVDHKQHKSDCTASL